jgi:hypothetical protein
LFGFQILDITPEKAVLEVAPGRILYLSSDEKETTRDFVIIYKEVEPIRQRLLDKNIHLEEDYPWWLKFKDPDHNGIGIWSTPKFMNLVELEMAPEVIYGTIRFHLESKEESHFVIRPMEDPNEYQSVSAALISHCKAIGIVSQGAAILISRFSEQIDAFYVGVPVASAPDQLPEGSEFIDIPAQDYAVYPIHKTMLEGEQRKTELINRVQHSNQTLTRPEQFYIVEHDPGEDYIEAYIPYVWKDAEYPLALLLDHHLITMQPDDKFTLHGCVFPESVQNQKVLWSTDQHFVNLTDHGDGSVTVHVAEQGKAVVKGYTEDGRVSKVCNVRCVVPNLKTNLQQLRPVSGDWCEEVDGMRGQGGSGDIFMVSSEEIINFVYETDVVIEEGGAAALMFRVQSNASGFYCAFIDAYDKSVKLWRTETAIKVVPADIERNRTYHLKVEMREDYIKVYLDGKLMFDVNDSTYSDGCLGLNVFAGRGVFQNLYYQAL